MVKLSLSKCNVLKLNDHNNLEKSFIAISNIYVLCVVVFSDHCRYKVDMIVGLFGVHRGADLSHMMAYESP